MKTSEEISANLLRIGFCSLRWIFRNPAHFLILFNIIFTMILCGIHFNMSHVIVFVTMLLPTPYFVRALRQIIPGLNEAKTRSERETIINDHYSEFNSFIGFNDKE